MISLGLSSVWYMCVCECVSVVCLCLCLSVLLLVLLMLLLPSLLLLSQCLILLWYMWLLFTSFGVFHVSSARVRAIHHSVYMDAVGKSLLFSFVCQLCMFFPFFLSIVFCVCFFFFICFLLLLSFIFHVQKMVCMFWGWWLTVLWLSQRKKTRVRQTRDIDTHIVYDLRAITYINVYNGWMFSCFEFFFLSFHFSQQRARTRARTQSYTQT